MELKLLSKQELTDLYEQEMVFDFPKAELKPLRAMLRLMDLGQYDPLLITDDQEQPLGYAMLWLPRTRQGALLEYLGVLRGKRNGGLGSQVLPLLADRYGQLFGEAEAPDSDDPAENDLRRRRIAFYERNGFRVLDYDCALFGVHFKSLYLGPQTDDRKVEALHRSVYADYFSPEHMRRYIQIPLRPGEEIHHAPEWVEEDEEAVFP
ncbi:MAG TPA: GNAT family N-acetyltransferase [Candidatus Enterenecus stercoripullorum]|nr:GNAT family N-acetyltransferase [Candidatus Enterenecus stercoripullorum]